MERGPVAPEGTLHLTNIASAFCRVFGADPVSTVVTEGLQDNVLVIPVLEPNAYIVSRSEPTSKHNVRYTVKSSKKTSHRSARHVCVLDLKSERICAFLWVNDRIGFHNFAPRSY
ncbi:MAG: hypothetical protein JWL65_5140 [Gammaproteobacteria bacterium]|nr:hypothetical protein [Gammaproteobacteria bacterium]